LAHSFKQRRALRWVPVTMLQSSEKGPPLEVRTPWTCRAQPRREYVQAWKSGVEGVNGIEGGAGGRSPRRGIPTSALKLTMSSCSPGEDALVQLVASEVALLGEVDDAQGLPDSRATLEKAMM
jgi:hypothetical protein